MAAAAAAAAWAPDSSGCGAVSVACDYSLKNKMLTLLMRPGYIVRGSVKHFLWSSGCVEQRVVLGDNLLDRLLRRKSDVLEFQSTAASDAVLGFSTSYPGEITVQSLATIAGMFVFRESFLCASQEVAVVPADFPLTQAADPLILAMQSSAFIHHSVYYVSRAAAAAGAAADAHPLVFMQAGESILEKRLGPTERFIVSAGALVAFEDTVTVTLQHPPGPNALPAVAAAFLGIAIFGGIFGGGGGGGGGGDGGGGGGGGGGSSAHLSLKGPGIILISSNHLGHSLTRPRGGPDEAQKLATKYLVLALRISLAVCCMALLVTFFIKSFILANDIRDLAEDFLAEG